MKDKYPTILEVVEDKMGAYITNNINEHDCRKLICKDTNINKEFNDYIFNNLALIKTSNYIKKNNEILLLKDFMNVHHTLNDKCELATVNIVVSCAEYQYINDVNFEIIFINYVNNTPDDKHSLIGGQTLNITNKHIDLLKTNTKFIDHKPKSKSYTLYTNSVKFNKEVPNCSFSIAVQFPKKFKDINSTPREIHSAECIVSSSFNKDVKDEIKDYYFNYISQIDRYQLLCDYPLNNNGKKLYQTHIDNHIRVINVYLSLKII